MNQNPTDTDTEMTPTGDHVLECVVFATTEGVERDAFVRAAARVTDWAATQPGYVDRELYDLGDGRWIDTVRWASMDAALAAADAIGSSDAAGEFVSKIDGSSIQMMHGHPVLAR